MGQFLRRQTVLECVRPSKNQNKYYEINIYEQDETDKYRVSCRWGRIEHFEDGNPQQQDKTALTTWTNAEGVLAELMFTKLKKGYKIVKDTGKGSTKGLSTHSAGAASVRVETQTVAAAAEYPFERTEHVEVAQSDWWKTALENIEERIV